MQHKSKLIVLSKNQAANDGSSSNFINRYRNDKLRIEKLSEPGEKVLLIKTLFVGKYSNDNSKERPLVTKMGKTTNYCILLMSNKLKEKSTSA